MYGPNLAPLNFDEAPGHVDARALDLPFSTDDEDTHSMRDYEALALARTHFGDDQ